MKYNLTCKYQYSFKGRTGYVLPSVLLVSFIITTALFMLLSLVLRLSAFDIKKVNQKKLELACESAVNRYLAGELELKEGAEELSINGINVIVQKEYKGLFLKFTAKAFNHADSVKIVYDLAEKALSPFDKALIISAPNLTATVAGETEITGDMLLTTKNIQMGRIFGIENASSDYHEGDIIVDGAIKAKAFDEAPLRNLFFDINKPIENASLIKGDFLLTESSLAQIGSMRKIFINGSLTISGNVQSDRYSNPLNITVSGGLIIEENAKCDLDMLIACSSKAYIKSGANLSGMVISSLDTIEIMPKTTFKDCQVYSSSSIKMEESYFGYPSIIGIYVDASKQDKLDESLEINNSVINGSVLLVSSVTGLNTNKSIIRIDDKSYVQGLIYSENNSGIEGKVDGIIYTRNFYFYKDPTEYINWMVNLNVNRKNLDEHFLLPAGFANDAENLEILNVKWMR